MYARVEEWKQSVQSLREFAKTIGMSKSHHQVRSDVSIEITFPGCDIARIMSERGWWGGYSVPVF